MRPIVILIYSLMSTMCEFHKVKHAHGVLHDRMIAEVDTFKMEMKSKRNKVKEIDSSQEVELDENGIPIEGEKSAKVAGENAE